MLRSRLATAWCFASAAARLLSSSRPVTKPWIWRRSTGGRGGARSAAAGQWHQWCSVVAPAARQRAFSAARRASMRLGWWVEAADHGQARLWPASRAQLTQRLVSESSSFVRSICAVCAAAYCPRGLLRPPERGGQVTRSMSKSPLSPQLFGDGIGFTGCVYQC